MPTCTGIASLVLLAGAVLFVDACSRAASRRAARSPAEPTPDFVEPLAVDPVYQQEAPVLAQMSAQVERLQQRTSRRAGVSGNAARSVPVRRASRAAASEDTRRRACDARRRRAARDPAEARGDRRECDRRRVLRTAVLSFNDDVQILKPGETIGKFVVRAIAADGADLVDPSTGATFHISLR